MLIAYEHSIEDEGDLLSEVGNAFLHNVVFHQQTSIHRSQKLTWHQRDSNEHDIKMVSQALSGSEGHQRWDYFVD